MTDRTKKMQITLVACLLLFIAAIIASYFIFIAPKKEEAKQVEQKINAEKTQLQVIDEKINRAKTEVAVTNTFLLQKQLPVAPLTDQFLLLLEKAEVLSDTLILDVQLKTEDSKDGAQAQKGDNQENEQTTGAPVDGAMKQLTATVKVSADNYYELEKFLKTAEDFERLTFIQKVTFKGKEETTKVAEAPSDGKQNKVDADVTFVTYYAPSLIGLKKNLPLIEYPAPSKKTTPLYENEEKKREQK